MQLKTHTHEAVQQTITNELIKTCLLLGIDAHESTLAFIAEDIMEVYPLESIEDVAEMLKSARQGKYGFGFNSTSKMTMIVIAEWMVKHIERKCDARDVEIAKRKEKKIEPIEGVDYAAHKLRLDENKSKDSKRKRLGFADPMYVAAQKVIAKEQMKTHKLEHDEYKRKSAADQTDQQNK